MKAAFIWSFLGQYSNFIIQIVSVIVLARLLTPTELGTFAIGAALLSLAQTFKDLGVTQYLVRETDLSLEKKQGALFISWFLCLSLALVLVLIAEPIGDFYGSSELTEIVPYLAINILITPLSLLNLAQIKKEMRFKLIAFIESGSALVNVAVAISLAYAGYGPKALVFASISSTLCTALLVNYFSIEKMVFPKIMAMRTVVKGMSFIAGVNVLSVLTTQGQPLLIGRFLNEAAIAIFDKGVAIIKILESSVFTAINNVLLPLFSQLKKDGKDGGKVYAEIITISVAISWPFLLYAGYYADILVELLFGEQWGESAPLVPYFCLSAAFYTFTRNFNVYMLSNDKDSIVFKLSIVEMILRVTILIIASPLGLLVLVKSLAGLSLLRLCWVSIILSQSKMVLFTRFLSISVSGLFVLLISAIPLLIAILFEIQVSNVFSFLLLALCVLPFWIFALYITKNRVILEVFVYLQRLKSKMFS